MNFALMKQDRVKLSQVCRTILFCVFTLLLACERTSTGPVGQWRFLGFEDKFPLRLVIAEPYLYVCAGSDGVWRKNIRQSRFGWEYLGLRDTTLGKYTNVGALDMDVRGEDVLVAYNGSAPHISPQSTVGIWRSTNGGKNWFRSDSGIPQSITDPYEYNVITSLQRSPHEQEIVLAVFGLAKYKSTDGGNLWQFTGNRGVLVNMDYLRWHPFQVGEVWIFGRTALFAPYCDAMQDYGATSKVGVNFNSLGFPSDGSVNDLAFDAANPNIIYAATSYGVIKTNDGGYTWQTNAVKLPDNGFVFKMAHHPSLASVLYLAGGKRAYVTYDGGVKVQFLGEIERGFITSLVLESQRNELFVGTTQSGIYALKLNENE